MNEDDPFNPLYMQFECRPDFCLCFMFQMYESTRYDVVIYVCAENARDRLIIRQATCCEVHLPSGHRGHRRVAWCAPCRERLGLGGLISSL
jgi:hypothetical protein